ncbi:ArsR/SmtB family transcription factor [Desulfitibacter alkalitolerans]|uniref:ArsR/SmtB family transcription factor n=1 Tax=Desulfitibacter alkalitolerans TaxID=264641 RepID=UPI0005529021|nr:metalloregulator ArsR/SmtB family transcription factor [Desulfitibacter alkalitolerans]
MDKIFFKEFKALGEVTRVRILKVLSVRSMCVCELSQVLDIVQPRVSQHLKILKEADLVKESREGYWIFYSINKERIENVFKVFMEFLDADLRELQGFEREYQRYINLDSNEKVKKIKKRLIDTRNE